MTAVTRKRQDQRRRQIVETARAEFLRHGYGATTMSAIATALGGSKTTLWSYFRNKQDLFAAVVDAMVEQYGEALRLELPADGDSAAVLELFGKSLMRTLNKPQIIAMHRMVIAEAGRSRQLGVMLWERGAMLGQRRLAEWLSLQSEAGRLSIADVDVAAQQFVALCQATSFYRHLMGTITRPPLDVLMKEVEIAVGAFLKIYRSSSWPQATPKYS